MATKDDIRDFLVARRAAITPAQAGIRGLGDERRVPGLRREEVADLAGVSLDYYTRLERGNVRGASDSVLNAIARALQLNEVERTHLFDLARPTAPSMEAATTSRLNDTRRSVQRVVDAFAVPAIAVNAAQDLLTTNRAGATLFALHLEAERPNVARFIFLDSRARLFYADWPLACSLTAAMLRYEAGRDPLNADLTSLVGELSMRSPQFRQDWADQDVHEHRNGTKTFRHPVVGDLELTYDVLTVPGEPGITVTTYSAESDSPTSEKLSILSSWVAGQATDV